MGFGILQGEKTLDIGEELVFSPKGTFLYFIKENKTKCKVFELRFNGTGTKLKKLRPFILPIANHC